VFGEPFDRPWVEQLTEAVTSNGGVMCFARLVPPPAVLEARVGESSRAAYKKIQDVELLRRILAGHDCYTAINDDDLTIDNSTIDADEVAATICAHFGLGA
jgi:hypothetical protein